MRARTLQSRLRQRVIVTLKTGQAFDGVLVEADQVAWVLRNAQALAYADRGPIAVDGEVIVLAADIAFAQRP